MATVINIGFLYIHWLVKSTQIVSHFMFSVRSGLTESLPKILAWSGGVKGQETGRFRFLDEYHPAQGYSTARSNTEERHFYVTNIFILFWPTRT